jgi:hypothetical protein
MGASSTGLFADDTACDVRDEFIERLASGATADVATQQMLADWGASIADFDDGPVFWLSLAHTQWKYGCLSDEVRQRALAVIDSGADLQRWAGPHESKRRAVLNTLKAALLLPQPKPRRPRKRKVVEVPSIRVMAPDGRAEASAFSLSGPWDPLNTQVLITVVVGDSVGGGGVFSAECRYTDVRLTWLDADTLQISFPAGVRVQKQDESTYFCGKTISVAYTTSEAPVGHQEE